MIFINNNKGRDLIILLLADKIYIQIKIMQCNAIMQCRPTIIHRGFLFTVIKLNIYLEIFNRNATKITENCYTSRNNYILNFAQN